jgi:hypothetical protein
MTVVRAASLVLAVLLNLPGQAHGHQEERPQSLEMTIYSRVQAGGDRLELLVRTPLFLLTNVGLPLKGEHQVDPRALDREDPHAPGDATYAERASAAILKAIGITSGREPVRFSRTDLILSARGNAAFAEYADAKQHVRRGLAGSDDGVDLHHGYLDLRAIADLPESRGPLRFKARVGPALAKTLTVRVRQISPTGRTTTKLLRQDLDTPIALDHLQ